MGLGALLRPANPERSKMTTYECGEVVTGDAWINFNIRFYLVALIFVIFDIEVAFMYPVLAVFRDWVAQGRALSRSARSRLRTHPRHRPRLRVAQGRFAVGQDVVEPSPLRSGARSPYRARWVRPKVAVQGAAPKEVYVAH
jgi:hypothetical protein